MSLTFVSRLTALCFLAPLLAPSQVTTPYHTEQEWIVSSICRNAFELLAYAKDKKGESVAPDEVTLKEIPGPVLSYDVTLKGPQTTVETTLQWPGSIWSPAAYVPFCKAAAQALKLPPSKAMEERGDPLHVLLDFSEPVIEAENRRVSDWLRDEPDNPVAHEQAALVLGTLAMKENSGYFWDPRDICNHVCTHLAVAQFLRGSAPMSVEGKLADITVGLIVDTKTQTGLDIDAVAATKDASPDLAAWVNACRMRNTRDWRIVKTPETASGFEQVEYVRALSEAVHTMQAIAWMQAHNIANRPDWNRIILEMDFPVDAGHLFAEKSVEMEIQTMKATFPASFGGSNLVGDLNEPPGDAVNFNGSAPGPDVISRGMWAQFFQRHLCHAIAETGNFYANKWSVPDTAQAFEQKVDGALSGLTMYPYLQLVQFHLQKVNANPTTVLALFTAHPEWAPDCLFWLRMPEEGDSARIKDAMKAWFNPPVVQGTAYGAMSRAPEGGWDAEEQEHLYAIAPLQIVVARLELKRLYGKTYTLAQIQKVMGPLLDYYLSTMGQASDATDLSLDQRADILKKAAALDPGYFYGLAHLYRDNHQEDKAAEAYQEWFDKEMDRVSVASEMDWLVNYYFDHGQVDKAMAIAKDTAEVYSYAGLATMMKLQERMGHLDEAEEYGEKIQERYNEVGPLAGFYKRLADKGTAGYQSKLDDLLETAFPSGVKKVTLASFSVPPSSGICFSSTNSSMQAVGLSSDQVVVALDGYEVDNQKEYTFIRELTDSPAMDFIVWDGKTYREIKANQPTRRFGVPLRDYQP